MFCLVWGPFPRSFACQYSVLICHLEGSEPIQGSAALASPPLALPGSDFPIVISANTDTEASDKDGGETTEKKKKKGVPGFENQPHGVVRSRPWGVVRADPDHRPH